MKNMKIFPENRSDKGFVFYIFQQAVAGKSWHARVVSILDYNITTVFFCFIVLKILRYHRTI